MTRDVRPNFVFSALIKLQASENPNIIRVLQDFSEHVHLKKESPLALKTPMTFYQTFTLVTHKKIYFLPTDAQHDFRREKLHHRVSTTN